MELINRRIQKSELHDLVGITPPEAFREGIVINLDKQIDLQILNSFMHF